MLALHQAAGQRGMTIRQSPADATRALATGLEGRTPTLPYWLPMWLCSLGTCRQLMGLAREGGI